LNLKNFWWLQLPSMISLCGLHWFFWNATRFNLRYLFVHFAFNIRFFIIQSRPIRFFFYSRLRCILARCLICWFCSFGQLCFMLLFAFGDKCPQDSNRQVSVVNLAIIESNHEDPLIAQCTEAVKQPQQNLWTPEKKIPVVNQSLKRKSKPRILIYDIRLLH